MSSSILERAGLQTDETTNDPDECALCGRKVKEFNRRFGLWRGFILHMKRDYVVLALLIEALRHMGMQPEDRFFTATRLLHLMEEKKRGQVDLEVVSL